MTKTKKTILIVITLLILPVVVIVSAIIHPKLPYGCRVTIKPMLGGCFGKQLIKTFEGKIPEDCLSVDINDCNMPSIHIINDCKEPLIIKGVSYKNKEKYSADLEPGFFTIKGLLSNKPLLIRGYVTIPLCR